MKDEVTNKNPFVISILYYKRDSVVLIESATLFLTAFLCYLISNFMHSFHSSRLNIIFEEVAWNKVLHVKV